MFLVEFYRDLLMAAADNQPLSPKSILDKMLIRYQWLEGRRIMTVKSNGGGFVCPYGYDYNGQEVVFSPLLLFDRVAYHVLMYMTQGDVFVVKNDVRKSLFRTLANIFGRQLIVVRPDVNPNFKEALVGGLLTNSWLLIESLDFLQAHQPDNLNFLLELALKVDNARKFGDNFVELLDKEIDLGSCVKVFVAKSNLHSLLCPIMTEVSDASQV